EMRIDAVHGAAGAGRNRIAGRRADGGSARGQGGIAKGHAAGGAEDSRIGVRVVRIVDGQSLVGTIDTATGGPNVHAFADRSNIESRAQHGVTRLAAEDRPEDAFTAGSLPGHADGGRPNQRRSVRVTRELGI